MNKNKSISPITGKEYLIPDACDEKNIKQFLSDNSQRKTVVIQGLGFVGTVMSLVVANSNECEYAVIGLDQATTESYWKIGDINKGLMPITSSDPQVNQYFNETKNRKNFFATHDIQSFSDADVIIVDINLDLTKIRDIDGNLKSYSVPMERFRSAMRSIGQTCRPDVLVLIETTVPPGTCKKLIYPIITEEIIKRGLSTKNFLLGHSYERVMPGPNYINSIKNFYRVYSGIDDKSADAVEEFLKTIISTDEYPLTRLKTTESTEMAKVLENSYRAMNISFVNEWSRFAEKSGVDLYEVIDAIRLRPTHANLMYPGIGVGGYCLTKDPLMASWAAKEFYEISSGLKMSEDAVENNDHMPRYCYDFVKRIFANYIPKIRKIALLGVAYGPGIGDTRFSPVEDFYNRLSADDHEIFCHDPYLDFWPEVGIKVQSSIKEFLNNYYDALIITTAHKVYIDQDSIYDLICYDDSRPLIIDTVGLLEVEKLPSHYELNKNFHVLGVG